MIIGRDLRKRLGLIVVFSCMILTACSGSDTKAMSDEDLFYTETADDEDAASAEAETEAETEDEATDGDAAVSVADADISETDTDLATVTEAEPVEDLTAYIALGSSEEGTCLIKIRNSTDVNITDVLVNTGDSYSDDYLAEGDVFTSGQTRTLYLETLDTTEEDSTEAAETEESAEETVPNATIKVTVAGGDTYELIEFPYTDMSDCSICMEDEVMYVEYVSLTSGQTVSTKDAQIAEKERLEAEAAAAAAAAAAASQSSSPNGGCIGGDGLFY